MESVLYPLTLESVLYPLTDRIKFCTRQADVDYKLQKNLNLISLSGPRFYYLTLEKAQRYVIWLQGRVIQRLGSTLRTPVWSVVLSVLDLPSHGISL